MAVPTTVHGMSFLLMVHLPRTELSHLTSPELCVRTATLLGLDLVGVDRHAPRLTAEDALDRGLVGVVRLTTRPDHDHRRSRHLFLLGRISTRAYDRQPVSDYHHRHRSWVKT